MSALAAVELRRIVARRLVRVLAAAALLGIAVAGVWVFLASDPDPPGPAAVSRRERAVAIEECMRGSLGPPEDRRRECRSLVQVPRDDPRFRLTMLRDAFLGTSLPLVILGWVIGASSIGAEWGAGTITTLLTWEPRRVRVLATKALVGAAVVFVATVLIQMLVGAALFPAAALRGTTRGADAQWLLSTAGVVVRGATVAAIAALIGFSVASIGRNAAAALGVGFLYLAVVEGLVRGLRPQWVRWMLGDNAAAFISGDTTAAQVGRSTTGSGVLLALYGTAMLLAAISFFRARDVG